MSWRTARIIGSTFLFLGFMAPGSGWAAETNKGAPAFCVREPGKVPDGLRSGLSSEREIEMNGPAINGTRLLSVDSQRGFSGARDSSGTALRVVTLQSGVTLADGAVACDVKIEESALRSQQSPAIRFVGAQLVGRTTDGDPVRLRIDEITPAPDPHPETATNENADLLLYRISWQPGDFVGPAGQQAWNAASEWRPLCPDNERAVALAGQWSYASGKRGNGGRASSDKRLVTLACQQSAVAKCVERMGYKPWAMLGKVSLESHHEACVRAVRADYCGDGIALTRTGQSINLYDALGIQKDTVDWKFESEWTAQGARCLSATRLLSVPGAVKSLEPIDVKRYVDMHCRPTFVRDSQPCLGGKAGNATLLWTEYKE